MMKLKNLIALGILGVLTLGAGIGISSVEIPVSNNVQAISGYDWDFTTKSTSHSNYIDTWTYDGRIEVYGAANNNAGWAYIRVGGKSSAANKTSTLTSLDSCTSKVASIQLTALNIASGSGFKMDKIWLDVSTTADFSNIADSVYANSIDTSIIFTPSSLDYWAENSYFKLSFSWSSTTSSNRGMDVEKVVFNEYIETNEPSLTLSYNNLTLNSENKSAEIIASAKNFETEPTYAWTLSPNDGNLEISALNEKAIVTIKENANVIYPYEDYSLTCHADGVEKVCNIKLESEKGQSSESALSVEEALLACDIVGTTESELVYVEGTIVEITQEWQTQYENMSFTIGDTLESQDTLLCYRISISEGLSYTSLTVGTKVIVKGNLINYNGNTKEMTNGNVVSYVVDYTLENISVSGDMIKKEYREGDSWDYSGIKVEAHYSNGLTSDVTNLAKFSTDSKTEIGVTSIIINVSYTELEITVNSQIEVNGLTITEFVALGGIVDGNEYYIYTTRSNSNYYLGYQDPVKLEAPLSVDDRESAIKITFTMVADDKYTLSFVDNGETKYIYATNTNNGVKINSLEYANKQAFEWTVSSADGGFYLKASNDRYLTNYNIEDWRCYTKPYNSPNTTSNQHSVINFELVEDSSSSYTQEAATWAKSFNADIGETCIADGSTDLGSLNTAWSLAKSKYDELSVEAKEYLKTVTSETSDNIDVTKAVELYDYVYKKYNTQLTDGNFLQRDLQTVSPSITNVPSDNTMLIIIVVISILSVSSIALFAISKRKAIRK